jgi:hypothetical protein
LKRKDRESKETRRSLQVRKRAAPAELDQRKRLY